MTTKRSVVGAIALIALTAVVTTGAMPASAGENRKQDSANQLVGSWEVVVDRPPPLSDLRSLQTFTRDGSSVENANGGTALRGPSHGAWEHVEGRLYASTIVFFRFNPQTGAYLGTQKINRTLRLSTDGDTFTGIGVSTLFDPAGNVIVSGLRAPEAGVRIRVERIPDQP